LQRSPARPCPGHTCTLAALLPCLQGEWEEEFSKYKATPEYLRTNQGMTVDEFKFIYFWEWGHRMWGRALGEWVGRCCWKGVGGEG
jgi:hypothetical protein